MADLASEQFLTEREERYLLKLVYRSANETAGGYYVPPKRRIIKMEVCNLRSSDLTRDQIKALAVCLPSLQCGPRTDAEHFDQKWCKERLHVRQFSSTSQLNIIPPSALTAEAARRKGRPQQPDSSQLLLVTPVHPEQIDIQALANTQNHFNFMEFEGRKFVRVTSSVHSPDGRQRPKKWRVSDYNLKGQMILSVICTITMDVQISSSEERRHSEQEESRGTT
ncbi:uncharacterized protein LOC116038371 isoform X1 [Sander lucioperca]|uniref:uncharacterized protein LOC116038371 isoform X1 n=1 Tax=Sander lucioperca TaxID=283035 RepID=UPI00125E3C6C|nr:uncharacterized protein LOC116038371 isoform X1 [Sander lucioperca]